MPSKLDSCQRQLTPSRRTTFRRSAWTLRKFIRKRLLFRRLLAPPERCQIPGTARKRRTRSRNFLALIGGTTMHAKRLTRRQLVSLFHEFGYPIGKSTLDKLCMPPVNEGPPVAAWWG